MAAQAGSALILGLETGKTYSLDLYLPDAVATKVGISTNGIAASTSDTQWFAPEKCVIKDVSIHTGQTAVAHQVLINSVPLAGGILRNANFLDSLSFRPKLNIPIERGQWLGFLTA